MSHEFLMMIGVYIHHDINFNLVPNFYFLYICALAALRCPAPCLRQRQAHLLQFSHPLDFLVSLSL